MNALPRLLLVEDDTVSGAFLTAALGALPAQVDLAVDAAQARQLAHAHRHALWLVDANLPDASGEGLLATLRAALPAVPPALALTADAFPERHALLRAAGFVRVLVKPLDGDTLRAEVRAVLAGGAGSVERDAPDAAPWDDQRALAAAGGRRETVDALRGLFLAELPKQRTAVVRALRSNDEASARAALHQLKASCAFVGAARLLEAVRALHAAPDDGDALAAFERECDALAASA